MANFYCEKCNKTMSEKEFYSSNNLEKYPEGKLHQCKKCISMHVDNWDPESYLWILQECDVPYVPTVWNKLMAGYAKDKSKVTGMTILGRYLSAMKLKQWKEYRWKDTQFIQDLADKEIKETMKRQGYSASEITEAIQKDKIIIPEGELAIPVYEDKEAPAPVAYEPNVDIDMPTIDLTEEDKRYLLLKWGKSYKPEEWIQLEKLYNEMMNSYDIQSAGHIDILRKVCKTSLKTDQLLDIGDVEGAQKMSKTYDMLMKSGNFTAVQNKSAQGEFVDSIGEIVALCEKEGFIPRYYTTSPQDQVDFTLRDMQRYTYQLVTEEMHLGDLIEQAIKNNSKEDDRKDEDLELDDENGDIENIERSLKDEDFVEYNEFLEEESEKDTSYLDSIVQGDEE